MYGLTQENIARITNVLEQFPAIENAIIYGSRVKGNFKPSSDIDIVLKGKAINLRVLSRVTLELDDLLLPNKFDISIYHHIDNKELLDHIKRVGVKLYPD
jgi:predicted nucleotidyltransferase